MSKEIYADLIENAFESEDRKETPELSSKLYVKENAFGKKLYFFTSIENEYKIIKLKKDFSNVDEVKDLEPWEMRKIIEGDREHLIFVQQEKVVKGETEVKELPPGFYTIGYSQDYGYYFIEQEQSTGDKYYDLGGGFETIKTSIEDFYKKEKVYRDLGMLHKMGILLYGPPGCHQKGTEVIMIDGSVKKVEDVRVGDYLMGPDSKPREVLRLARGREEMVKIKPTKGEEFVINKNHILHLTPSGKNHTITTPVNMKFSDYIQQSKCFQERMKLTRTGIEYKPVSKLDFCPYVLGLWLGDGTSREPEITTMDTEIIEYIINYAEDNEMAVNIRESKDNKKVKRIALSAKNINNIFRKTLKFYNLLNNKHIPDDYLLNSRKSRLKLLAGLIDSDGHNNTNCYEIVQKNEKLANQIVLLSRSLGFASYVKPCIKKCKNSPNPDHSDTYYRVTISGDLSEVPVLLERKKCTPRKQIKDVLRTGFTYEMLPEDDYYGFTLSDDHLYLTSDFTIHHNCGKSMLIRELCKSYKENSVVIFVEDALPTGLIKQLKYFPANYIFVLEELTHILNSQGDLAQMLNFLDGEYSLDRQLVIGTTNYPEALPENLASRPSRFDKLIKVDNPDEETRRTYLTSLLKSDDIDEVVKETKDMSIAYLKEIVISSKIAGTDIMEAIKENKKRIKIVKEQFATKSGGTIGFN